MTDPTVIAHRGFAGQYPENTVTAVRAAAEAGADAVEVDVQPTADGDVVAFHDRRLDGGGESRGITDGSGVVWERSTAAVTAARVLDTDERVPLLDAVFSALPDDVAVNVELKNPGSDAVRPGEALDADARAQAQNRWAPFVESVRDTATRFDNEVLYSSFCEGALAALEALAPEAARAVLVAPDDPAAGAAVARRYDADAINHPLSALDGEAGRTLADAATALGASRYVWTVRDWQAVRRALDGGADGIIADYAGLTDYPI